MSTGFKEIEESALQLDEKSRAKLAKSLLESLEGQIDEDVEQAWMDELIRRQKQIESGEVDMVSGAEVLRAARNILKGG